MPTTVPEAPVAAGKVQVSESVPASVKLLLAVKVFPLAIVRVPVEEVMVKPLIEVAVATPNTGVTSVGELERTTDPVPVEVVVPVPPLATAKVPVTEAKLSNPVGPTIDVPL